MEGSSGDTLELEFARFARSHVQGLPVDAEQDQLVQATRKFLTDHAGSILLVVDDVADAQAVLKLLPTHRDTGQPVAHVIMTAHQEGWPSTMQLTNSHRVDALSTDESVELLQSGKGLKKEVLDDAVIMARIRQFVEEELGNLTISVAMLKKALRGLGAAKAAETINKFESSLVESLQDAAVDRNLRGLLGTVAVLLQRVRTVCGSDGHRHEAAMALMAMVTVLNPAGVPDELFLSFEAQEAVALGAGAPAGFNFGSSNGASGLFGGDGEDSCDQPSEEGSTNDSLEEREDEAMDVALQLFEDAELYKSAASALAEAGLVTWEGGVMRMHQLVQQCVRHQLTEGQDVGLRPWGSLWRMLRKSFVGAQGNHSKKRQMDTLYGSANAVYKRGVLGGQALQELCSAMARFHHDAGKYEQALPLYEGPALPP